jgi:hypothetical protein
MGKARGPISASRGPLPPKSAIGWSPKFQHMGLWDTVKNQPITARKDKWCHTLNHHVLGIWILSCWNKELLKVFEKRGD